MNALWTTRMAAYKHSSLCVESAKKLIAIKITRERALLSKYKKDFPTTSITAKETLPHVLLEEARMAKSFWREYGKLVPAYLLFPGRRPRGQDITNRLLDIGYHHITNIVKRILAERQVPPDLGLLHVARNADSAPLAYDLVEMFRSDIVEAEVLRYLRLKKKPIVSAEVEVAHFLHEVNERLERKYYLKDFKMCHTYRYYMEVQILKFIKAVNKRMVFEPMLLPRRHEQRCLTSKTDMVDSQAGSTL